MNDQVESSRSVSVIGLGAMGFGIARRCIEAGYRVSVWNRSSDKIDAIASIGAIPCKSPRDALASNVHTVVCLAGYSVWKNVIEDHDLDDAFKGNCIIQLTGGTNEEVQEHASFIEAHGGRVAEGAVMCFPDQLGTDDASILVSGLSGVLEECEQIFNTLCPTWTNLGEDITAPSVLSRALVTGIATSLVGFVNSIAVCQAGGISLDVFMEHTNKANSILPAEKNRLIEAVQNGRTEETQASIKTWAEGHQTAHAVARSMGTNLVLQDAVQAALQEGRKLGLDDHDLSALVKVFASD